MKKIFFRDLTQCVILIFYNKGILVLSNNDKSSGPIITLIIANDVPNDTLIAHKIIAINT